MNLKLIDASIKRYEDSLEEVDKVRLAFFRTLWDVAAECAEEFSDCECFFYKPAPAEELMESYALGIPALCDKPVEIDVAALVGTAERLSAAAAQSGFFAQELADALAGIAWEDAVRDTHIKGAGNNPHLWLERVIKKLLDTDMDEEAAFLGGHLASIALKVQLEVAGKRVSDALKKAGAAQPRPTLCPVCGTVPSMAHVGGPTSSSGRGRLLVCPQCSATWEYERVRCARCGSQSQQKLHLYNVEGDDAHKLAICEVCGDYIRTLYSEDVLAAATAYEVEDVLMVRLDAIARDLFTAAD